MTFLDALLGRTRRKPANLDALFALPGAAVTLQAEAGMRPSGRAAVAYKPASGQAFEDARKELEQLLSMSARESETRLREHDDRYGYRWIVLQDPNLEDLVGSVHLVNSTLEGRDFGPQLLCSVFGFELEQDGHGQMFLVYLYKRGTFYPFAPLRGERRDNELELRIRGLLEGDLPLEPDLSRWFPLWGIPIG